jgi:hypothetical protein
VPPEQPVLVVLSLLPRPADTLELPVEQVEILLLDH